MTMFNATLAELRRKVPTMLDIESDFESRVTVTVTIMSNGQTYADTVRLQSPTNEEIVRRIEGLHSKLINDALRHLRQKKANVSRKLEGLQDSAAKARQECDTLDRAIAECEGLSG